jgi:GNAT superfamily N-acetyltransferase
MIIRKATVWDAQKIAEMWKDMHEEINKREDIKKEHGDIKTAFLRFIIKIESLDWNVLVAEQDGDILGFISGFVHYPEYSQVHILGTCENLYVAPWCRGRGIHKNLVDELRAWGESKKATQFEFGGTFSERAIKFWDKLGYEPVQVFFRQKEVQNGHK